MDLNARGLQLLDRYRPLVDAEIAHVLGGRDNPALYGMIHYHLGIDAGGRADGASVGGKRVRATLCSLSCEAGGGRAEAAAPAAAAVELFHSFTLLHDDIADRDETRRGRQTVWHRWGVGEAMLAGDALFALANVAVSRLAGAGVSGDVAAQVSRELNETALAVCEGQQMDLAYEGRTNVSVENYMSMIGRKTAALLAAAAAIGARVADASGSVVDGLRAFGLHLGIAYQIRDDLLGIWGDPARLGKPVGSDLRRNKRSLPILHALATASEDRSKHLSDSLSQGIETDEEAAAIAAELAEVGSRTFCKQTARESLERALAALDAIPLQEQPARDLRTLASYLMERAY